MRADRPRRKNDGGLSFHKVGKGKGVERLERGAKIRGLKSLRIIIYYYSKAM
jgi:hypothetical protein